MGLIALFDKSFLQSLSVDESVWFDHFFIPNICPLFYVETLADLEKSVREGRTPEREVGRIAEKTPVMRGARESRKHVHLESTRAPDAHDRADTCRWWASSKVGREKRGGIRRTARGSSIRSWAERQVS
jgi:hypothetical protein